jgi:predicted RNA-binding protein with PIN domain
LPGGVLESSVEAADHLLRLPGVLFLVDGYNVAMAGWPGPPLPAQRTRLLDTLDSLVARGFAPATVVFDGGGDGGPAPGRRGVRVEFTAQGTIADDVLVLRAAEAPAERPVVVATSDRELCERLRRVGANVIGAGALLGLARVAAGEAAGEAGPGR